MTITSVGTAFANGTGGADVTIDLTTITGLAEGDLVIVYGGSGGGTGAGTSSSGWTTNTYDGSASLKTAFIYKFMGATPDSSITCNGGGSPAANGVCYVAIALRGVDPVVFDATPTTTDHSSTTTDSPDNPSITTVTNNAVVVAAAVAANNDSTPGTPPGYSSRVNTNNSFSAAMAIKTVASAGAENPGAWPQWNIGAWLAVTVALRPLTVISGVLSASGVASANLKGVGVLSGAIAANGVGTFSPVGLICLPTELTAAGIASATFIPSTDTAIMTAAGAAIVDWIGAAEAAAALSAAGLAGSSLVGNAVAASVFTMEGLSAADFVALKILATVLGAAGIGSFSPKAAAIIASMLTADGVASSNLVGFGHSPTVLSAAGQGAAAFTGTAIAKAILTAAGLSEADFNTANLAFVDFLMEGRGAFLPIASWKGWAPGSTPSGLWTPESAAANLWTPDDSLSDTWTPEGAA